MSRFRTNTRYTHVSIVELGSARIVLHWKYALSDSTEQANVFHGNTWAEEFHTIYPDGLTVRKLIRYPGNENRSQGQPVVWEVAELDLVFAPGAKLNETIDAKSALRVSVGGQDPYVLGWPATGERWLCRRNPQSCDWPAYVFRPSLQKGPEPFSSFQIAKTTSRASLVEPVVVATFRQCCGWILGSTRTGLVAPAKKRRYSAGHEKIKNFQTQKHFDGERVSPAVWR